MNILQGTTPFSSPSMKNAIHVHSRSHRILQPGLVMFSRILTARHANFALQRRVCGRKAKQAHRRLPDGVGCSGQRIGGRAVWQPFACSARFHPSALQSFQESWAGLQGVCRQGTVRQIDTRTLTRTLPASIAVSMNAMRKGANDSGEQRPTVRKRA